MLASAPASYCTVQPPSSGGLPPRPTAIAASSSSLLLGSSGDDGSNFFSLLPPPVNHPLCTSSSFRYSFFLPSCRLYPRLLLLVLSSPAAGLLLPVLLRVVFFTVNHGRRRHQRLLHPHGHCSLDSFFLPPATVVDQPKTRSNRVDSDPHSSSSSSWKVTLFLAHFQVNFGLVSL